MSRPSTDCLPHAIDDDLWEQTRQRLDYGESYVGRSLVEYPAAAVWYSSWLRIWGQSLTWHLNGCRSWRKRVELWDLSLSWPGSLEYLRPFEVLDTKLTNCCDSEWMIGTRGSDLHVASSLFVLTPSQCHPISSCLGSTWWIARERNVRPPRDGVLQADDPWKCSIPVQMCLWTAPALSVLLGLRNRRCKSLAINVLDTWNLAVQSKKVESSAYAFD